MTNNSSNPDKIYGEIFNIEHYHINDGAGIRTNVFLKGCPLHCTWCCNPESQKKQPEVAVYQNLCKGCLKCVEVCPEGAVYAGKDNVVYINRTLCTACGECAKYCPANAIQLYGKRMSAAEVVREAEKDLPFYRKSGGGVTLSGGEPALQPLFSWAILALCKKKYIGTAIETSGAVNWDELWETVELADEILYDIKMTNPEQFKEISSVPLQLIKNNLIKLREKGKRVILRYPLIPRINDSDRSIDGIVEWANEVKIKRLDIIPFHQLGRGKYHSLDKVYLLEELKVPEDDQVKEIKEKLEAEGLVVNIGG